jgi:predicted  nucleic acid-binding Zn-ribbon protein
LLLLAVLLGQARPSARQQRGRPDGGPILLGTDPPGRLKPSPSSADGGVSQADAGPDEVRRELQALRARVEALEQDRARSQQTIEQLQQLNTEVQQLRQQIADAEAQRQAADEQRAAQQTSVQSAIDALYGAQQKMSGGNSSIEAELERAESAFSGQARRDVEAARAALRNRDLGRARAYLNSAIANAQAGR